MIFIYAGGKYKVAESKDKTMIYSQSISVPFLHTPIFHELTQWRLKVSVHGQGFALQERNLEVMNLRFYIEQWANIPIFLLWRESKLFSGVYRNVNKFFPGSGKKASRYITLWNRNEQRSKGEIRLPISLVVSIFRLAT